LRDIDKIIVHCSATPECRDISAATIDKWHKQRGWSGIGYHFVVKLDGTIEYGRMVDKVGAHCKGHNSTSIGICYIGGVDSDMNAKDTRTNEQVATLLELIRILKKMHPGVEVFGHRDFSTKECPSFDAKNEYKNA